MYVCMYVYVYIYIYMYIYIYVYIYIYTDVPFELPVCKVPKHESSQNRGSVSLKTVDLGFCRFGASRALGTLGFAVLGPWGFRVF